MEINETMSTGIDSFNKTMRLINLVLSCTGIVNSLILLVILIRLHRQQCTTYFILILMIVCDFLYCTVYTSILLTIEQYFNIINHQILCPLSFFLTPFAFTGSTLLLFICLLHLVTSYIRRYDTFLGQIGGRLSVVFVCAFLIIRSVLGSTSIELITDVSMPHIQHCTIDMNTPDIVTKVQNINHIFAEVTDILVYIGWIVLLVIYFISLTRCRKSEESNSKSSSFILFVLERKNQERSTSKRRHHDVSWIMISITLISIVFYCPVMTNKFSTMNLMYLGKTFLNDQQILFLQIIQQTTHLFGLTVRFLPYFLFDKGIKSYFHRMMGMKIQRKNSSKRLQKYICHCQCSRRQPSLSINQTEHDHLEI